MEARQHLAADPSGSHQATLTSDRLFEALQCPICLERLYIPWTFVCGYRSYLPKTNSVHSLVCGHTFCQGCLVAYFEGTQATFKIMYPLAQQRYIAPLYRFCVPYAPPAVQDFLARGAIQPRCPTFTCPRDRSPLTARPVPNYPIKELVDAVAELREEPVTPTGAYLDSSLWSRFFAS